MAAGDAVVKGTNEFTEQLPRRRWSKERGWQKVREWEGPYDGTKLAALLATINGYAIAPEDIDVEYGWPTVIRAAFHDGTKINDTGSTDSLLLSEADDISEWSLEPYDLEKALGTHGKFHGSGVSPFGLAVIDSEMRQGVAYDTDYEARFTEGASSNYNTYAKLKGMGVESYQSFGYILRRTLTCSRATTFIREYHDASANHGKVITWDQIRVPTSANIYQPWVHMYVSVIWTGIKKYKTGSAGGWADVYFDEWLVKPPATAFVREGMVKKRRITQEYIGATAWSAMLYDGGKGTP